MISNTCDYGTLGVYRTCYGHTTSTSTNGPTISPTSTWDQGPHMVVTRIYPRRQRAIRSLDLDLPGPQRGRCFYAREESPPRPPGVALAAKTARRTTTVAWTRGRPPLGLSLRTLRALGTMLRR